MPLAEGGGGIAVPAQHVGDRDHAFGPSHVVAGIRSRPFRRCRSQPGDHRVPTGARPASASKPPRHGTGCSAAPPRPAGRAWQFARAAKGARRTEADIVEHDDDNIWALLTARRGRLIGLRRTLGTVCGAGLRDWQGAAGKHYKQAAPCPRPSLRFRCINSPPQSRTALVASSTIIGPTMR